MEQPAKTSEPIPIDTSFWPSFLMAAALSSISIGIIWDISWHESIGRDTFWTPAHMAIYLGGVLAGFTGGWLAIKHTFFAGPAERDASVRVFGARAPLGAWVAIWGAIAMITSAPFDDWWHNAYGLDVRIISPPHVVLGLGMLGIAVGALLLVLSRQNRLQETSAKSLTENSEGNCGGGFQSGSEGTGLFIYTGGVFVLLGSVFLLEYIFPNRQHGSTFYIVCGLMFPPRLIALSCAGRVKWPATKVAAVYMIFLCVLDWILALFPAQPKLAPIFNPVTHMVPLPFPLLLIFPALIIDLVLQRAGEIKGLFRSLGWAALLGGLFFVVFLAVQWFSAKFMLSSHASNWFFMADRHWSYSSGRGNWRTQFWDNSGPMTILRIAVCLACTIGSSWVGLFFGNWMRKVRR